MAGEIPEPEQDRAVEAQPFDIDALADDQIIVLYRGLTAVTEVGRQEEDSFDQLMVGFDVRAHLVASVRDLSLRDPERVMTLVARYASSTQVADREFAASTVSSLAHYDYEFTRDTLIALMIDQERQQISGDEIWEVAHDETSLMMRDHVTPEQIADFNAHLAAFDRDARVDPALPGER